MHSFHPCYILLLVASTSPFKSFRISEEDRDIPPWTTYPYSLEVEEEVVVREYVLQEQDQRTYLLCPRGYVIGQVGAALLLGPDQLARDPGLQARQATFPHHLPGLPLPSHRGDRVQPEGVQPIDLCPTLARCLLHQACVFNFGNELCLMDPNPGTRKNIDTNITCVRDDAFLEMLKVAAVEEEVVAQFHERKEQVMNIMYDSKLDYGIEDFANTVLTFRAVEEQFVFGSSCPAAPRSAGYSGECAEVAGLDATTVAQNTWHLTSRVRSARCRDRVVEVYCAFQYNMEGKCVPPHLLGAGAGRGWQGREVWGEAAYPLRGSRPVEDWAGQQQELEQYQHSAVLPARIGFALLVHKDVPAIMQLLLAIYRPHHYYVLHVDKRKEEVRQELMRQVHQVLPVRNVVVLPTERSYTTSWGGMGIVRAHLEQFEELARMGVWDFIINMSGSDLNLRDVDDLALALAPYRGHNFFAFHGGVRNEDLAKDQGLCWEAWYECDGFTYNITRTAGQPTADVLQIKTTSQWATLSRDLVEHLLDQQSHPALWRTFDFHMQTSVIPDESYLSTFALNSRMRGKTHHVGLYWLKSFSGKDKYNLCKHLGDADFCGQGPSDIDSTDLGQVADMAHRYFFARKFPTSDTKSEVREMARRMEKGEYYTMVSKYLPKTVVHQLLENAWRYLRLQQTAPAGQPRLDLTKLAIVPVLHPTQPCCSLPFERHYKSIQEFSYILDFTATMGREEPVAVRAKYLHSPQCFCYPAGHLRALRVTGWTEEGSQDKKALSINTPFPFHPAGSQAVFSELWFHSGNSSLGPACRSSAASMEGWSPIQVDNLGKDEKGEVVGDTLVVLADLVDPQGDTRCSERVEVGWSRKDGVREGEERAAFLTMSCGSMEAGLWHLEVRKEGVERPYVYRVPMLFLPLGEELARGPPAALEEVDLLQGMWSLHTVAPLPLHDLYHDQPRLLRPFQARKERVGRTTKAPVMVAGDMGDWLVCSGGLVTMVLVMLFTYNCLYLPLAHPSRYHTRALYPTLASTLAACILQALLCSIYC